jgi:hypothetical protein
VNPFNNRVTATNCALAEKNARIFSSNGPHTKKRDSFFQIKLSLEVKVERNSDVVPNISNSSLLTLKLFEEIELD